MQSRAGVSGGLGVRMSKGVHLVLPKERLALGTGVITRTDKSVLLVIPWGDRWIVGTTDTEWNGSRDDPAADADDVDYLLSLLNGELSTRVTPDDVVATYAGLRPLLQGRASSTAELSRSHAVTQPLPGLVVVAGGKYTTYRVMAADAVDLALSGEPGAPTSRSEHVRLAGAVDFAATAGYLRALAGRLGLDADTSARLQHRYGGLLGRAARPRGGRSLPRLGHPRRSFASPRRGPLRRLPRGRAPPRRRPRTQDPRSRYEYRDHGAEAAEAVAGSSPRSSADALEREAEVAAYRARRRRCDDDAVVVEEDHSRR